jgi:hypothetical protein
MAYQNPNGTANYWYQGSVSTLITFNTAAPVNVNSQAFWYIGKPDGYLIPTITVIKYNIPRVHYVLIGF